MPLNRSLPPLEFCRGTMCGRPPRCKEKMEDQQLGQVRSCVLAADGVFSAVGVQRDVRSIEGHQQLGFVGVETGEQPIEGGKAGAALEDAVETGAQGGSTLRCRIAAVGL